jgi:hypothetical protein
MSSFFVSRFNNYSLVSFLVEFLCQRMKDIATAAPVLRALHALVNDIIVVKMILFNLLFIHRM